MTRITGNLKQAADYLGVSYTTARNLQEKGLPLIKSGRRGVAALIDLEEAKRWYDEEFLQPAAWQARRDQLLCQQVKLQELARQRAALYQRFIAREQEDR